MEITLKKSITNRYVKKEIKAIVNNIDAFTLNLNDRLLTTREVMLIGHAIATLMLKAARRLEQGPLERSFMSKALANSKDTLDKMIWILNNIKDRLNTRNKLIKEFNKLNKKKKKTKEDIKNLSKLQIDIGRSDQYLNLQSNAPYNKEEL